MALQRSPVHRHGKLRIGNFVSFSHFWLWRNGIPPSEMQLLEGCRRALPAGRRWIAVDVGAHLGHFALALAVIGFDEVHAFEPVPETYERLQRNFALNAPFAKRITPYPLGVAQGSGSAVFAIRDRSPGQSRIGTPPESDGSRHIRCSLTSLDEQFAHRPKALLGIVKVDVEGFETAVVRGAGRLLAERRIMFVYAEVIPQALEEAGSSAEELASTLAAADFLIVRFSPGTRPMFIQDSLSNALSSKNGTRNVLFAHKSILERRDAD